MSRVSLPGHDAPSAGFDAPFEMLAACHERVERSLQLLERLGAHLPAHGADAAARDAARDVLRYFDIAAPPHHQDEERHVLPALRAAGQVDLAERIEREHVALAAAWAALRPGLQALADAARAPDPMLDGWAGFAAAYRAHAALEDSEVFPRAGALLDAAARTAMGREMATRRGVPWMPGR